MASKLNQLIRAQAGKSRRVYNDKLADGTRSVKVSGWLRGDYKLAKSTLEAEGYEVKLVEFDIPSYAWEYWGGKGKQVRLHVTE
jgi:hypothetical protein